MSTKDNPRAGVGPEWQLVQLALMMLCTSATVGVQVTVVVASAAQEAAGSPSETLSVSVTDPGAIQVKVGVADVVPSKFPESALQA